MWIYTYGAPQEILMDNGRQFTSCITRKSLEKNNIKPIVCTPYNPTGNGIAERINASIVKGFKVLKGTNLTQAVISIEQIYNNTHHTALGISPNTLTNSKNIFNILNKEEVLNFENIIFRLKKINSEFTVKRNLKREVNFKYKKGMYVLLRNENRQNKIEDFYDSKFEVLEVSNDQKVIKIDLGRKKCSVNAKRLKLWKEEEDVRSNLTF